MKVCSDCPFRKGSPLGYDQDAMDALKAGNAPSCHKVAGLDSVFKDPFPTDNRCDGFDAWVSHKKGFVKPVLVSEGDT